MILQECWPRGPVFCEMGGFCGSFEGKVCLFSPGFCADFLRSLDRAGYPFFHVIKAFLNFVKQRIVDSFLKEETVYTSKQLWKSWFIYLFDIFLCLFGLPPSSPPAKKHAVNSQTEGIHLRWWQMGQVGFHDADSQTSRLGRHQCQVEGPCR